MKLSCWIEHAPGQTLTQRAEFLARAGFDGFEIFLTVPDLMDNLDELRRIVDNETIDISAIGPIHQGWLVDPERSLREAARREISSALQIAADLGDVPVIVIPILGYTHALPGGRTTGRSAREDTALLIEALDELGRDAERVGSTLLLEVINRYESPIVNQIADGVDVIQAVDNSRCRLAVDFFHMNLEEVDLVKSLHSAAPVLAHVHMADSTRFLPGFGQTDFLSLFSVLSEISYDGYLTVEAAVPHRALTQTLPLVARYLRALSEVGASRSRLIEPLTVDD